MNKIIAALQTSLLCLCTASPTVTAFARPEEVAQQVLDRLYHTNGNYQFRKPKLVLTATAQNVAWYASFKNTIYLEKNAYELCRGFGKDSLNALAFILGHELAHSYQSDIKNNRVTTSFMAYDRHYNAAVRLEKSADIQSIFNGFLAGYSLEKVAPELLERVYAAYGLKGKILAGYPTLEERKKSYDEVSSIASELWTLYQSANLLMAVGKYQLAKTAYEHVLKYYQGAEVYNNLALAAVFTAREYYDEGHDRFIYPFEMDWETKLQLLARSRGAEALSPEQRSLRNGLLREAEQYLRTAQRLNPKSRGAQINLLCLYTLMGNYETAYAYYNRHLKSFARIGKPAQSQEQGLAQIAYAILESLQTGEPQKKHSREVLNQLAKSSLRTCALIAQKNLDLQNWKDTFFEFRPSIELPPRFKTLVAAMSLGKTADLPRTRLDDRSSLQFAWDQSGETTRMIFSNSMGNLVSLVSFRNSAARNVSILPAGISADLLDYRNIIPAGTGYLVHVGAENTILRVDESGRVLEMTRYWVHRN